MIRRLKRREFLGQALGGIGAAGVMMHLPLIERAYAQTTLVGVQWGGPWVEASKAVAAKQDSVSINWELHTGGAAAVIPKIMAAWPNPRYDFVAQYTPLYYTWRDEGWPEPVTPEELPNLRDIPNDVLLKNDKGEALNVPFSRAATLFGYRKDITPFPIKKMEDLLDPRLAGKVVIKDATSGLNSNTVMFALAFGGDERNLEPGWDFLKRLAQSGNVARVAKSEVDFINALTLGEAAVGFWNMGGWKKVAENFPCEMLIEDKAESPGFQAGLLNEGFMIPKNSANIPAVKEFLNFFISPENNTLYNKIVGSAPTNIKAEAVGMAKLITFADDAERERYTHTFDYEYLAPRKNQMIERFETEIVPLLQ